jgi:hypothetical protein
VELQKFITDTLLSITQGVEGANKVSQRFALAGLTHHHKEGAQGEFVEFDVALEVGKANEKGAKGKIGVAVADIGGDLKTSSHNQSQHRIKFKVFVTEK